MTVKKSIRLREEALAKEQVKTKSGQTSAEKLRKILKEEKRYVDFFFFLKVWQVNVLPVKTLLSELNNHVSTENVLSACISFVFQDEEKTEAISLFFFIIVHFL